jgi:hypothetical protein
MIAPHCPDQLPVFPYNHQLLEDTQTVLKNRRKRRVVDSPAFEMNSFTDLLKVDCCLQLFER